jgi:hypothetical protein
MILTDSRSVLRHTGQAAGKIDTIGFRPFDEPAGRPDALFFAMT